MTFASVAEAFVESVNRAPDAVAIDNGASKVRYDTLFGLASAVFEYLADRDLEEGARIALLLPNDETYIAAYFGTLLAGHVAVPLNFQEKPAGIGNVLGHAETGVLIVSERYAEVAGLARKLPSSTRHVVLVGEDASACFGDACTAWSRLLDCYGNRTNSFALPSLRSAKLASIVYTSGTSGSPKGVMLSHGNLAANTASILAYLPIDQASRGFNLLPFYYAFGNSIMLTHLAAGSSLVLEDNVAFPAKVMQRLSNSMATGIYGVPTTYRILFTPRSVKDTDFGRLLPNLRFLAQAGGSMPVSQQQTLSRLLPGVRIYVMYGQTEATARLTYLDPQELGNRPGSVGKAIEGVEIRVGKDEASAASAEEPAEVYARGDNVMLGYWRDEDGSRSVLQDGWLRTGDLGYLDGDGYLYLVGRSSEMIKTGANRVSPLEIEEVIGTMEEVRDVAAFPVSDKILGQAIAVAVVPTGEGRVTKADLRRHCLRNLASYKVPKHVYFVREIPLTATGKILRRQLSSMYEEAIRRDV